MLLADTDPNTGPMNKANFYRYACILGMYHINVRPGSMDYWSQWMEFLWVWWYDIAEIGLSGWNNSRLIQLCFPPVTCHDAFGFVDLSDILRGCHIGEPHALGSKH